MIDFRSTATVCALFACALASSSSSANEPIVHPSANNLSANQARQNDVATGTTGQASRATIGKIVDADRLGQMRGGLDTTSNRNSLDASVHDNSASYIMTGANSIADGSFANSVGLPTVIQNSGANVLIQNSTIVNVQLR